MDTWQESPRSGSAVLIGVAVLVAVILGIFSFGILGLLDDRSTYPVGAMYDQTLSSEGRASIVNWAHSQLYKGFALGALGGVGITALLVTVFKLIHRRLAGRNRLVSEGLPLALGVLAIFIFVALAASVDWSSAFPESGVSPFSLEDKLDVLDWGASLRNHGYALGMLGTFALASLSVCFASRRTG